MRGKEIQPHISRTEKVLLVLANVFDRVAHAHMGTYQYEKYIYYRNLREEVEERRQERRRTRQALSVLERAGNIVEKNQVYHLTPTGWIRFASAYARALKKLKKKHIKGKKQLIVIFDIQEKQRVQRDALRRLLYSLGFSLLQQSVFIGSDPKSFELVAKVASNARLGGCIKLLVVDRVL